MTVNDKFKMKLFVKLDNYLYHKISTLSIKMNDGVHPKHRILDYHEFFLNKIEKNSKILDVGCGTGEVAFDISKKAQKVVAIDINKKKIESAKRKFSSYNLTFIVGDATDYNFNDRFDYIVLSNVLEHIKDRQAFLKKVKNFGLFFLIRVPMINRSWLTIYKKELGFEYRLDKTHYIEYTLDTFKNELNNASLEIIDYQIQFGEIWAKVKSIEDS